MTPDATDITDGEPERLYPEPEAPPSPGPGFDLEGIQRRLQAAREGALGLPNAWRSQYAEDVASLLAELRREHQRR